MGMVHVCVQAWCAAWARPCVSGSRACAWCERVGRRVCRRTTQNKRAPVCRGVARVCGAVVSEPV